ncbi:hypothetical protein [Pedobacter sp. ASV28]|uniref:hypothetical protein n=1 Tax=Pedobacter sp. ASV28 TaxID=2795123 RepID=UPI0018ECCCB9|nr:hypothetical protein [Pedobacter sp. ASV28]
MAKNNLYCIVVRFVFVLLLIISFTATKAQQGDYKIKVVSYQYKTVKGQLKKVNAEGIGIEDDKGNYYIFRTADLIRIKIKKRGLTIGKGAGAGALTGLGIGGGIWSVDENGNDFADMAKLTIALTATGAMSGTLIGAIAEVINHKLTLRINGNQEYFNKNYIKLVPYVNPATIQHVSN